MAVLIVAFGPASLIAADKEKGSEPAPEVTAQLETTTPILKPGEQPQFTLTLTNRSSREVLLVKPGDGSDCGWRTPVTTWLIDGERRAERGARCGNINRLKPDEVVVLKPGEKLKETDWLGNPSLALPGKYKLSVRYVHDPKLTWKGVPLGKHDAAAMERITASRRVEVESNAVEIVVKE
jgi:hypothetical protein